MRDYSYAIPILFLLPALGILFFLQFVGWGWNINIVLHDVTVMNILREWQFVGLENFREAILNPHPHVAEKYGNIHWGLCKFTTGHWHSNRLLSLPGCPPGREVFPPDVHPSLANFSTDCGLRLGTTFQHGRWVDKLNAYHHWHP